MKRFKESGRVLSYDNICKFLAENYPEVFANWLFPNATNKVEVLKTELSIEPIRADSVTFLKKNNSILHLEFQTLPKSKPPVDFRVLEYYTRLKREYNCPIEQIVIFLLKTTSQLAFKQEYVDTNTSHRYRVIRMWEQDPAPLLANPGLLPLAPLALADSSQLLLEQVAQQVDMIEDSSEQGDISACTQILAGLRFNQNLIRQLFREELMQESVIYQEILQRGEQRGVKKGELNLVLRLLLRRIGAVNPELEAQIRDLSVEQVENLAEALLDFQNETDLVAWLQASS